MTTTDSQDRARRLAETTVGCAVIIIGFAAAMAIIVAAIWAATVIITGG